MTRNELASIIAKYEGKKVEVSIGNIREILRILRALLNYGYEENGGGCGADVLKALLK